MNLQRVCSVVTACILLGQHSVVAEEKKDMNPVDHMKKRLEHMDKQGADKERLQKEAETDPALAAALQKRDTALEAMKAHLQDAIAAVEAGNQEKMKELGQKEKDLGQQLESCNRNIEFARKAAGYRRELDQLKKKTSEHPDIAVASAGQMEKALTELAATYDGLVANPPAKGIIDDATAQKISDIEGAREKAQVEAEFEIVKTQVDRQLQEVGDNAAVKEAAQKLIDLCTRTHDSRIAMSEARAKERALQQERSKLETALREAIGKARKEKKEQEIQAQKAAAAAPAEAPKPAGEVKKAE